MTGVAFTVYGNAQTSGSVRPHQNRKTGALFTRHDNPHTQDWKREVKAAAGKVVDGAALLEGPLVVSFVFHRPRPLGHFASKGGLNAKGRRMIAPTTKPDVLKLARAIEDALTGIVWRDDAQIVDERIVKLYGEPARVEIDVRPLEAA